MTTPKKAVLLLDVDGVLNSFSRNIPVANGRRIELRIEAFNLFDHENWANPTVQIGSTSLTNGRVTNTVNDPRTMQFAVKYNF